MANGFAGTATAFDPYIFVKEAKKAGFTEAQAEIVSAGLSSVRSNPDAVSQAEYREHKAETKAAVTGLATKQDVSDLRSEMNVRFERQDGEIKLIKWMAGFGLLGIASILAIAVRVLFTLPAGIAH